MESIYEIINTYMLEIILIASALSIITILLALLNFHRTSKMLKKYKRMMRGMDNKNLEYLLKEQENMIKEQADIVNRASIKIDELDNNIKQFTNELDSCIRNATVVRYNPFDEMGGDQSFSIALLNEHGNGVVLTGLYSREASTTFAKPIINFSSKYPLSNEEKQAIDLAIKKSHV